MSSQSEAALENGLIATLQQMNYEFVHIEEEKNHLSYTQIIENETSKSNSNP